MSDIVWQDPPAPRKGFGRSMAWYQKLLPLVDEPKRWALIHHTETAKKSLAAVGNLRRHITKPPGVWEFTSRKTNDGGGDVYARYLGPEDES